jgi:hypothetical protein
MIVYQGVQWQLKCSFRVTSWTRTPNSATASHAVRLSLELKWIYNFCDHVFRSWERTHTTLLCVCVLINPVLDANGGTHFANPVESSPNVSRLLVGIQNILNCALARPTTQLTVFIVTYLTSINLYKYSTWLKLCRELSLFDGAHADPGKMQPPLGYTERHPSAGFIPWDRGIGHYNNTGPWIIRNKWRYKGKKTRDIVVDMNRWGQKSVKMKLWT